MMKVKVCGMKEPTNIEALLKLPIDYIGFILYPKSKRFVGNTSLMNWINEHEELFGTIQKVGVVVNAGIHELLNDVHDYQLDYLQLHGDESAEYCREISLLWQASSVRSAQLVKAFAIDEDFDFSYTAAYEPYCSFFIFDTKGEGYGGTGKQFDWNLLDNYQGSTPFLLSGGLDENAAEKILSINHPRLLGVDLNSRFETEPGVKDIDMLQGFLEKIK